MKTASKAKFFPWGRTIEAFAWASLLAAFIIGLIAAQTDYEALLKTQMPEIELTRSDASKEMPVVYRMKVDNVESNDVMVMSEGVGYGGKIVIGIKARRTDDGAQVNEILMLSHKETPAFMAQLNQKFFFRQFAGKSVTDNFIIGDDVDAVSGATVSSAAFTAAIRDAVHLGAVEHLGLSSTWQERGWQIGSNEVILVLLFALAFTAVYRRDRIGKYARNLVLIGTLVFIGFLANASLNLGNIASIFMGYIPSPKQHTMWWIMMIGTLGSIAILGRNIYCHQLCPFMVVQDLLQKVSGVKLRIRPEIQRKSRTLIFFLSWLALMLIFLSTHPALGSYEPFSMMFSLEGLGIQWYILPITLVGSMFVPKFWCRMFCPVGLYLNELVRLRKGILGRFTGGGSRPKKVGKLDVEIVVKPKGDK
jgi:Na+-translocating ferredoxin:NAD+ oxidoreductase RnfG subunit